MRILGLDYGAKTVGAALSDPLCVTAQGLKTIVRQKENHLRSTLREILSIIEDYQVDRIVVGYPLNMDDTAGERAVRSEEFAKLLQQKTSLPVFLWDERLTTVEADEILEESGVRASERKRYIDKIAAQLILESYMNAMEEYGPEKDPGIRVVSEVQTERL